MLLNVAALALLTTAFGSYLYFAQTSITTTEPLVQTVVEADLIELPVPLAPIPNGKTLDDVKFTVVEWPKTEVTDNYIADLSQYAGYVSTTYLPAHAPILKASVARLELGASAVAKSIESGMRAITVQVDAETAVEGWANTGSRVDVISSQLTESVGLQAKVIAENVRILSANRSAEQPSGGVTSNVPTTVTLLVTPKQALKINIAKKVGSISFMLRNPEDHLPASTQQLDQEELYEIAADPEPDIFRSLAKGPDGKRWVLTSDGRWLPKDI